MFAFRPLLRAFPIALAALGLAAPLAAQGYPSKPITLIVPFAAGGPSDTIGRLVADHLGRTLGQQVVVENVGGAGGTLGAERAAKAAPDGYTLLTHHSGLPAGAGALRQPALRLHDGVRADRAGQHRPDGAARARRRWTPSRRQGAVRLAEGAGQQGDRRLRRRRLQLLHLRHRCCSSSSA